MRRSWPLCALLLVACEGRILFTPHAPTAPPTTMGPAGSTPCAEGGAESLVPPRVRRLLPNEYQATLGTLGVSASATSLFPDDPTPNGYANRADTLRMSAPLVQALWNESGALAQQAAQALVASSSCGTTDDCAHTLLGAAAASRLLKNPPPASTARTRA